MLTLFFRYREIIICQYIQIDNDIRIQYISFLIFSSHLFFQSRFVVIKLNFYIQIDVYQKIILHLPNN
nr:MAG TPA: hypothetical protein [Caudoviricetes sp.]